MSETMEEEVDDAPPPPPPPRANGKREKPPRAVGMNAIVGEADPGNVTMGEWLASFAGEPEMKCAIVRKKPQIGPSGENLAGTLETMEGMFDEDYIRETWGGGEYLLRISLPQGHNGKMSYAKGKVIKIAGEPRIRGRELSAKTAVTPISTTPEGGSAVERAMDMSERIAREQMQRAQDIEREARKGGGGFDPEAVRLFTDPLNAMISELRADNARLADKLTEALNRPVPRDELRDTMMTRMFENESKALAELRTKYEDRIDRMRESHDEELKRIEHRHDQDIRRLEDAMTRADNAHKDEIRRIEDRHARDLSAAERASGAMDDTKKIAFEARLDSSKANEARLERDLTAAHAKIAALEAIKNVSPEQQLEGLVKMKDSFENLLGKDDDDKGDSVLGQVIAAAGNIPAIGNAIERLTGGAPQQQQAPQQQAQPQIPINTPFRADDGNVYVVNAQGQLKRLSNEQLALLEARARKKRKAAAQRKKAPSPAQEAAPADGTDPDIVEDGVAQDEPEVEEEEDIGTPPSAEDVKTAVFYIENVLRARELPNPAQFAQTARGLLSGDVLTYLQAVGFERFLASVKIEPGSPILSIRGKGFLRDVMKALKDGA